MLSWGERAVSQTKTIWLSDHRRPQGSSSETETSWWESRQWWAALPGHKGISDPKRRPCGARLKIWASGSPSQVSHWLPKSHGGGSSPQRLSGSPAQERMKGINEVASENAVPPATSLKAHLHLFPLSHGAKLGPTWPKYHLEHLSLPFGPHRQVQCKRQYKSKLQ